MTRAGAAALVVLALASCGGVDDEPSRPAGWLTVQQALEAEDDLPVGVRGFLVGGPRDEMRLCDGLAESYPPQCAGPSLVVERLPRSEVRRLERAQGAAWSEDPVLLHGFVADGVLGVLEQPG